MFNNPGEYPDSNREITVPHTAVLPLNYIHVYSRVFILTEIKIILC